MRFPFGAPIKPCGAQIPDPVEAFVLGAYPSAVHVRWVPPGESNFKPISALAVDNKPRVFWDGSSADTYVAKWAEEYFDPTWGTVAPAHLNGTSGDWLNAHIWTPLSESGVHSHFVTDSLTTYRLSIGAARRIADTYDPYAATDPRLRPADLAPHPTESQIVSEALAGNATRLRTQIAAARPGLIVTLGDAAARVIAALSDYDGPGTLKADTYAVPNKTGVAGLTATWLAVVHPATPQVWRVTPGLAGSWWLLQTDVTRGDTPCHWSSRGGCVLRLF